MIPNTTGLIVQMDKDWIVPIIGWMVYNPDESDTGKRKFVPVIQDDESIFGVELTDFLADNKDIDATAVYCRKLTRSLLTEQML